MTNSRVLAVLFLSSFLAGCGPSQPAPVWNSKGNLEDEANCTATAMVYLTNYQNLPKGLSTQFKDAQKAYGSWITTYNEYAKTCEREMGGGPLAKAQSCITKKMGNGLDYKFGYDYLRLFIGYDKLLKSGRMSKMDLEMTLFTCAKL